MTKQQENRAFVKMLKEFPKEFGRVSFRERLMLRTAFAYINEEVIADIKANCDFAIEGRDIKIKELEQKNAGLNDEVRELKLLVSSLVYEINQIWDINEMNDDLRMCAEKIDREVQLSKMAEDNRIVISALGFAIVPPKPKLDVKEI